MRSCRVIRGLIKEIEMWRKLFKIFGARVCATQDFDGEVRYRFIKWSVFGERRCRAIVGWVTLNGNGTCSGKSYIRTWKEI